MSAKQPTVVQRNQYAPPTYWIESVELDFDLQEQQTRVRSRIKFFQNEQVPQGPLVLNGEDLQLLGVWLEGRELNAQEYRLADNLLTLEQVPERFTLEILVEINPDENTSLSGLYRSSGNFCTQCEAMGFRRITYFLDRPDVMATYRVTISADQTQYPVLLSNGNRVASRELEDGRHQVSWEDPHPKPSYLFALVAGDLRCHRGLFSTQSGRQVQLEIWVQPENIDRCEHALQSLIKAMEWDEQVFGLEYDLDIYMIVAVNDFNMGAMENKGLNVFNSKYVLARPDTATDADYELIEAIIAHEYFHNWTGNRVTCRDWFQLTLKEGLTVFRDQQFTADQTSAAVKRIEDVKQLRTRQFPEDSGPMAHPIRPESYISMDNFYTVTVYEKGAEIIRMYHTLVGADGFRKGMDLYFQRHDGQAVTCDDFRASMADANGVDLDQFGLWYAQAGTPELHVDGTWKPDEGVYELQFSQGYPKHAYDLPGTQNRRPLHLPVKIGWLGADGRALEAECAEQPGQPQATHLLELHAQSERYTFKGFPERPVPSVLREFSSPVRLHLKRDREELAFLMSYDSDPFNRWDAAQTFGTQLLLELCEQAGRDVPLQVDTLFLEAFGSLLRDEALDGAFKSLLLTLPGEMVLGQEMEVVDPDSIHQAREFLRGQLATHFRDPLRELYEACVVTGPYRKDSASIQARRLKNTALGYLVTLGEQESVDLAIGQFRSADNMTDQQSALACLIDLTVPERDAALAEFYDRWKEDPLVLDKWFGVQAVSTRADAVDCVVQLSQHPDYHLSNPNRVRSLAGTFGMQNQLRFHSSDGRGYAFLADIVLELDGANPQVAARLVAALNDWKRFDQERQALMLAQLDRIRSHAQLSNDVAEIVNRALGSAT
ncbi:MAG: aminopeptidase N [Planctomycetaceae bacterium]|nr:aminopeptidase N [Planctomycetaceae bacterium]|tara:strand:- start:1169 stop:3829 length:2661 start_codon:yes stop_codon:yes gene_type:complete